MIEMYDFARMFIVAAVAVGVVGSVVVYYSRKK